MTTNCVILLHGLARTSRSMQKIARSLDKQGYLTINANYPSTQFPIAELAQRAITDALTQCPKHAKIHFVTHSMGGILLRQYLQHHTLSNLARVVMLAPPNKGSQIVDKLKSLAVFQLLNGPAGLQLGTQKNSVPNSLGAANFELGIIAGTRSISPLLSLLLAKPNDGKVTTESTKLQGMNDYIELGVTHTFMMNNKSVIAQTLHFLENGRFDRVNL